LALPFTVTVPDAVTGGHAPAQAPEQADLPPLSFTHRYTARPEPSVRNVLPEDAAVAITVPPAPLELLADPPAAFPLAALLAAGAAAAPLLLPLLQAAASRATPTAPPIPAASLAGAGMRLMVNFLVIVFASCPARQAAPVPLRQMAVNRDTGEHERRDWRSSG
jgi:hypothetical protein